MDFSLLLQTFPVTDFSSAHWYMIFPQAGLRTLWIDFRLKQKMCNVYRGIWGRVIKVVHRKLIHRSIASSHYKVRQGCQDQDPGTSHQWGCAEHSKQWHRFYRGGLHNYVLCVETGQLLPTLLGESSCHWVATWRRMVLTWEKEERLSSLFHP